MTPGNSLYRLFHGKTLQWLADQAVDLLPVNRICKSQVHTEVSAWNRRLIYAARVSKACSADSG